MIRCFIICNYFIICDYLPALFGYSLRKGQMGGACSMHESEKVFVGNCERKVTFVRSMP